MTEPSKPWDPGPSLPHSRHGAFLAAAAGVEGWFSDMSAALWDAFLCYQEARRIRIMGDMLEIGTAFGRAALMLGLHGRPGDVVRLIDAHAASAEGAAALVARHSASVVVGLNLFSERADMEFIPARGTRFMHIDGDHGRWALHNDLDIAHRVVGPEGMVVLDDFLSPQFLGVTVGAIEWMARNPQAFELVLAGFNKAYLVRPQAALSYLSFIRDELPGHLRGCGQRDFTLWRTDDRRAFSGFGIVSRQWDRDFVTREFAIGMAEQRQDGKPEL